jgi:aryl-alcohol dehydrogenase-like predicted oxidoreductase
MRYRLLGPSGLRVSELALGTMTFGEDWGWGASREESARMFERFATGGGNFVDTASNYTGGTSERIVGELIASERDHFVVGTKFTLTSRPDDPNAGGNHRKSMVRSVDTSLGRLGTEYVDLLWLHMWDGLTPVEEVVRALDDLVTQGKVLYVGVSDTPAWVVAQAVTLADLRGWSRFVGLQLPYSIGDRDAERELLPVAEALGLTVTAWGILEGGALTGKYLSEDGLPRRYDAVSERANARAREVLAIAEEIGVTASQVATAWVRAQPWPIVPILGARTEAQLRESLGVLELELAQEHVERLSAASGFRVGFLREFLESEQVRGLIFGDTFERIGSAATPA